MKSWACPGCERAGAAFDWTVVERRAVGQWWIKVKCTDCGAVSIFTKHGVHSAFRVDGSRIQ